ncbi:hypothetical protein HII17_13655 [Thalassotalea sp. M1531]|uniref:Uncharacterized protein n=1 Tax=Thalassotalea algicola TaxID=2716224 RepID=A0A7Y0LEC5_9GAMM|nr:hypothetical protein [Thalassotalea algicola]NMP32607.1 hypothetical protein [Thalassotalea algicola]
MSEGIVTFFKHTNLGFYQIGADYHEPLEIEEILNSLTDWFNERDLLSETAPYKSKRRKTVYLKDISKNDDTGDYLITLWKSLNANDGNVYGLRANESPNDNRLINADEQAEEEVIWGRPAYYWFIPSAGVFASIKFHESITDSDVLNKYIKDYIQFRSDINSPTIETRTNKAGEEYETVYWDGPYGKLWLRVDSRRYTKITENADLDLIARDITHFVKKEEIITHSEQDEDWTRYFKNLPYVSKAKSGSTRSINIVVDAKPTGKQLKAMMEKYHQDYGTNKNKKSNLGFRKEGTGSQTYWLDEFVVKSVIEIPGEEEQSHFNHSTIFTYLNEQRGRLLAPFIRTKQQPKVAVNE